MLLYQIQWLSATEWRILIALAANILLLLIPLIVTATIAVTVTTIVILLLLVEGMGHEVVQHFDCLVIIIIICINIPLIFRVVLVFRKLSVVAKTESKSARM